MKTNLTLILFLVIASLSSCKKEEERQMDVNYNPVINPGNFVGSVTNVFFPLKPGTVFNYQSQTKDGLETIVVTVLSEKKMWQA